MFYQYTQYSASLLNLDVDVNDRCGGMNGKRFVCLLRLSELQNPNPSGGRWHTGDVFFSHCQSKLNP